MRLLSFTCIALSAIAGSCAHTQSGPRGSSAPASSHNQRSQPLADRATQSTPITLPHAATFTIESAILGETRRINVLLPAIYGVPVEGPLPVLYMPDGGLAEDFLHIAGLVQVLVSNGTMRPVILVGIENTQRRRDMTGPTQVAKDREIAPIVGGSAAFRAFLRDELMPAIRSRYQTTDESSIVGESLAGFFALETLFEEPELFRNYIAVDPSIWWNDGGLIRTAKAPGAQDKLRGRSVMVLTSSEPMMAQLNPQFASAMQNLCTGECSFVYVPMHSETHATIYHPAALTAFRTILAPAPKLASDAK
jgi:predicted alpha/beta superfamily hydrolase